MKTKLLRKIRKRFEYKFVNDSIHVYDKKLNANDFFYSIKDFIYYSCIDLNLFNFYLEKRNKQNRKYFDSLKGNKS